MSKRNNNIMINNSYFLDRETDLCLTFLSQSLFYDFGMPSSYFQMTKIQIC